MSLPGPDNAEARAFWSSPGWLHLWGLLMSGLRHDVTGRVSALNSLSIVASRGLAKGEMVTEELARESEQLAGLARVLDAFPIAAGRRAVGTSLADIVSTLPDVLRLVIDFRDADIELDLPSTLPAVVVDPGPAAAALLLSAAQALDGSSGRRCRIVAQAEDSGDANGDLGSSTIVSITVLAVDPGADTAGKSVWLCKETTAGIVALADCWNGDFTGDHEAGRYTLTAPTL
jgi:hypothetical protein